MTACSLSSGVASGPAAKLVAAGPDAGTCVLYLGDQQPTGQVLKGLLIPSSFALGGLGPFQPGPPKIRSAGFLGWG